MCERHKSGNSSHAAWEKRSRGGARGGLRAVGGAPTDDPTSGRRYMRRFLIVGLSVVAVGLFPNPVWAVSGAAYTTVNPSVDGPGHCKNGNPAVNCNIYDGKQYVWLNGGPSVAYVGDGSYFFAVLVPGGQADPNDGAAKNLSDGTNGDYTTRTFSVSGGTISYPK